jgi:hypothetical protein
MTLTRRTLLGSLFCAAAAPAIVRISSLMPVSMARTSSMKLIGVLPSEEPYFIDWGGYRITLNATGVDRQWQMQVLRESMLTPAPITPTPV